MWLLSNAIYLVKFRVIFNLEWKKNGKLAAGCCISYGVQNLTKPSSFNFFPTKKCHDSIHDRRIPPSIFDTLLRKDGIKESFIRESNPDSCKETQILVKKEKSENLCPAVDICKIFVFVFLFFFIWLYASSMLVILSCSSGANIFYIR